MTDKRRAKRISVELPVTVYLFDRKEANRLDDYLEGRITNFSPVGAALIAPKIQLEGKHLFYTCHDNQDMVLELVFESDSDPGTVISIMAVPVWFDRDLDSEKKHFVLGVNFLADTRSREIKILCREACKDEKRLVSLWKKLF